LDIPCTAEEKINVDMPHDANEWDFLKLFVTDEMIAHTVRETNRYAEQYITENADKIKDHSNVKDWEPTNADEMTAYIAIVILMGIVHKPRLNMYWSTDTLIHTPIFSQLIRRDRFLLINKFDRFLLINKFLHFANNDNNDVRDPNRDRLFKIREVTNMFKNQWKRVYTPGQNLCVDESLVLFKGRLAFKQYIKTKRSRFGIKFYTLSTDSGITLDNMIYVGNLDAELQEAGGMLTTERIPINLISDYLHEGRILYVDNFYTTPNLGKYLLDRNTHTVGTIRTNRRLFPRELGATDIPKGTSMFYSCENKNIMVTKYRSHKDKSDGRPKVVHVLSTVHSNTVRATNKRDKDGQPVKKPKCVIDYNQHMGGVDKIDQQLHQLLTMRKSYKWYKKIFLRLTLQSALNAHKLHKLATGSNQDFLGFLLKVIHIMVTRAPKLQQNPRTVPQDDVFRLTGHRHFPGRRPLPETSQRKKAKFLVKVCRVCSARGITNGNKTPWICINCPGEPGLHIDKDCFEVFHTKRNYSKLPT
jgi:hypothetical protein